MDRGGRERSSGRRDTHNFPRTSIGRSRIVWVPKKRLPESNPTHADTQNSPQGVGVESHQPDEILSAKPDNVGGSQLGQVEDPRGEGQAGPGEKELDTEHLDSQKSSERVLREEHASQPSKNQPEYFKRVSFVREAINDLQEVCREDS